MIRARNKYGNEPTVVDGVRYASKAEAKRGGELKLLEKTGAISHLKLQPSYDLKVNGQLVCRYRPDFTYVTDSGTFVVEDVKGVATAAFRIKAKLMAAVHGIDVQVVK